MASMAELWVAIPLANPILGCRIHMNVNESDDVVPLGSASGSCVSMILGKVTGP